METHISQSLSSIDYAAFVALTETITLAPYCLFIKAEYRIYAPVKIIGRDWITWEGKRLNYREVYQHDGHCIGRPVTCVIASEKSIW